MKQNFTFDGKPSREVLNSYLSRSVTHIGLGYDNNLTTETFEDDVRMLKNEGAKFIGRASYVWSDSVPDEKAFDFIARRFTLMHEADPEFILQACVFECVYRPFVNGTKIPADVFTAFGLEPEERCFDYDKLKFVDMADGFWSQPQTAVPDITRLEAQLWFYYRAKFYIDAGCEAIHLGQVCMIGRNDKDFACWHKVIDKIREYGATHARRHYVLIDAHTLGWLRQDETMFDYNAFPIRLKELPDEPMKCVCEEGYLDSMFNPKDGLCRPFIVEFDNFGHSATPGKPDIKTHYAWGYDEITWFSLLPPDYRHEFLRYIDAWVKQRYPEGWVQMPSRRCLSGASRYNYSANTASPACPYGWSDEETIKSIFSSER